MKSLARDARMTLMVRDCVVAALTERQQASSEAREKALT
jgi:hypothetical protein